MNDLWQQLAQFGGASAAIIAAARWIYTIERDMIRRYARENVELEKENKEKAKETERWRRAYWDLRDKGRNGSTHPDNQATDPVQ